MAATKSSPIDVVTEMDIAAEKLITGLIADRRPDDGFLGEEGAAAEGTSGVRWVIDPLDGTVNYLYGLPTWAVSIAAEQDGERVAGGGRGPDAGRVLPRAAGRRRLGDGCLGGRAQARLPVRGTAGPGAGLHRLQLRRRRPRGSRPRSRGGSSRWCGTSGAAGSAAIDLCDVAAGRLDGYYERGLHPWDLAAGDLIAREAGAVTGGRPGERPTGALTIAATPAVFEPSSGS